MTKRGDDDDDARAFDEAMRGARPIGPEGRALRVPPGPANPTAPPPSARREREELARGDAPETGAFQVEISGETISGRAGGVDARKVRELRRGHDRAEARLDLHGETRDEALAALERFVQEARAAGRRRVLVIHGRGSHSTEGGSILKPLVWRWLRGSRVAASDVLAFASGGPAQGGDGVTVLLLRKPAP